MKNSTIITLVVLVIFALIIAILIASRVGGIAIRNLPNQSDQVQLTISNPASRGVGVTVRWSELPAATSQVVELVFRDQAGDQLLTEAASSSQVAIITLPCAINGTSGTVILRDAASRLVLATSTINLLPPNQNCTQP